jgi:hypothetical protein
MEKSKADERRAEMSYEPIKSAAQANEEATEYYPQNRFVAPGEKKDLLLLRTQIYIAELLEKLVANTATEDDELQTTGEGAEQHLGKRKHKKK